MDKEDHAAIKLLLVEDDDDFRTSLRSRLVKRNFEVSEAIRAEDALEKIKKTDFDVIVSDIKLEGMDGIKFLAKVKEINESLPVILITGYASLETAKEAVMLKASDYILKPLDNIDDLLNPINSAIQNYNLIIENKKLLNELKIKVNELEKSKQKLNEQKLILEQKNILLKEGIAQIETERNKLKEDVSINIEELLLPILDRFNRKEVQYKHVKLVKQNLKEISDLLGHKITKKNVKLSPKEAEVCKIIKDGMTSKEISTLLNVTLQTVEKHRKNIRQKLGIKNKDINLTSYLQD